MRAGALTHRSDVGHFSLDVMKLLISDPREEVEHLPLAGCCVLYIDYRISVPTRHKSANVDVTMGVLEVFNSDIAWQ